MWASPKIKNSPIFLFAGFVTFIVGFFGVSPKLPKRYTTIDIEYFEKAINTVCKMFPEEIDSSAIGMMGISKGQKIEIGAKCEPLVLGRNGLINEIFNLKSRCNWSSLPAGVEPIITRGKPIFLSFQVATSPSRVPTSCPTSSRQPSWSTVASAVSDSRLFIK